MKKLSNKRHVKIASLISVFVIILTSVNFCFLSFAMPDNIHLFAEVISRNIKETDSDLLFSISQEGKRIDTNVSSSGILEVVKRRFFSYGTATKLMENDVFIEVSSGSQICEYNTSFLESEPTKDNVDYILHGQLPNATPIVQGSKFDYLISSDNALYVPQNILDSIISDFNLTSFDFINNSNLNISFKTARDTHFRIECDIRGSYNQNSKLGKLFVESIIPSPIIASPGLFDLASFSEQSLFVMLKHNKIASEEALASNHQLLLSLLDQIVIESDFELDFSYTQNQQLRTIIHDTWERTRRIVPWNTNTLILVLVFLSDGAVALLSILFLLRRRPQRHSAILTTIVSGFAFLFTVLIFSLFLNQNIFATLGISLITRRGLFYTLPVIAAMILPIIIYNVSISKYNKPKNRYLTAHIFEILC